MDNADPNLDHCFLPAKSAHFQLAKKGNDQIFHTILDLEEDTLPMASMRGSELQHYLRFKPKSFRF
jgi:hypothetical protein